MDAGRAGRGGRSASRALVDTRQGRSVESRTGAREARNHRVSEEQRDSHDVPSPSLWPIGFAIGIACILVGLVVSIPALIVGAIIALVFGLLWIRDLFVAHPVTAATAGVDAPAVATEADVGADVDRATFLSLATIGVGGL